MCLVGRRADIDDDFKKKDKKKEKKKEKKKKKQGGKGGLGAMKAPAAAEVITLRGKPAASPPPLTRPRPRRLRLAPPVAQNWRPRWLRLTPLALPAQETAVEALQQKKKAGEDSEVKVHKAER